MPRYTVEELVLKLFDIGGIKFGTFEMRTGEATPVYIDMRVIWTYPDVVISVAEHLIQLMKKYGVEPEMICGIPYQGIPLASYISTKEDIPMLLKRKDTKDYGTYKLFEGVYTSGTRVAIFDDVIMTGSSLIDDMPKFEEENFTVTAAYCFFDREQGGVERVKHVAGLDVYSVVTISQAFEYLHKARKVNQCTVDSTTAYLKANRFDTPPYGCPPQSNGDELNGFHSTT